MLDLMSTVLFAAASFGKSLCGCGGYFQHGCLASRVSAPIADRFLHLSKTNLPFAPTTFRLPLATKETDTFAVLFYRANFEANSGLMFLPGSSFPVYLRFPFLDLYDRQCDLVYCLCFVQKWRRLCCSGGSWTPDSDNQGITCHLLTSRAPPLFA